MEDCGGPSVTPTGCGSHQYSLVEVEVYQNIKIEGCDHLPFNLCSSILNRWVWVYYWLTISLFLWDTHNTTQLNL